MGVKKYMIGSRAYWRVDTRVCLPNGAIKRIRKSRIPTREQAAAWETKLRAEAFEGRWFERAKVCRLTVNQAWENYRPISRRKNKPNSYRRNKSIAKHLVEHLGKKRIVDLNQKHIDEYRTKREGEETWRGGPPMPGTVNREVALLKRVLNYAVKRGDIDRNLLLGVEMMPEDNVRRVVIDEQQFQALYDKAELLLKPILVTAYETGMRRGEILNLKWNQVNLTEGTIRLASTDTKSKKPRIIILTDRVLDELRRLPRSLSGYVFFNARTGNRWYDLKKVFDRARTKAELEHVWFHDLRRSFVTNARRRGVPESVVMKMSGHRTRTVFERYNIVSEEDLRDAVERITRGREIELDAAKADEEAEEDPAADTAEGKAK